MDFLKAIYNPQRWKFPPERELPKFIFEGKGVYDPVEVMRVFLLHDTEHRREKEADVFINGY
ncbi:MAG: hypothetical protein LBS21_04280 [Clostridiales bacterium]|jgi:hypothetical protein|nr:hypothetical protein [Clostridiales bacterium]